MKTYKLRGILDMVTSAKRSLKMADEIMDYSSDSIRHALVHTEEALKTILEDIKQSQSAKVDMTGWERGMSFDLIAVLRRVLDDAGQHQRAVEFSNKAHDNRFSYDQILDMCGEDGFIEISNRPQIRRAG